MRQTSEKESVAALLGSAHQVLGMGQEGLGKVLGVSRRPISRWAAGSRRRLLPSEAMVLARAVYPKDPALAERIAIASETTLAAALGTAESAKSASAAPLFEIVVCAAAEALDVSPRTVRPALLAAFRTARKVGLSVEDVEAAPAPPAPPARTRAQAQRES
jgi:hypothetical protein